jgi:hypothetical protein
VADRGAPREEGAVANPADAAGPCDSYFITISRSPAPRLGGAAAAAVSKEMEIASAPAKRTTTWLIVTPLFIFGGYYPPIALLFQYWPNY